MPAPRSTASRQHPRPMQSALAPAVQQLCSSCAPCRLKIDTRGARLGDTLNCTGVPHAVCCRSESLTKSAERCRLVQRLLDEVEPLLQELRRMPPGPERKCGPIQKPHTLH